MKVIIALLFLAAVAVYAEEEMEYHPQAVLHYLEMEDQEMARKVRRHIKMDLPRGRPTFHPSFRPSFRPSGLPISLPPEVVSTHQYTLERETFGHALGGYRAGWKERMAPKIESIHIFP